MSVDGQAEHTDDLIRSRDGGRGGIFHTDDRYPVTRLGFDGIGFEGYGGPAGIVMEEELFFISGQATLELRWRGCAGIFRIGESDNFPRGQTAERLACAGREREITCEGGKLHGSIAGERNAQAGRAGHGPYGDGIDFDGIGVRGIDLADSPFERECSLAHGGLGIGAELDGCTISQAQSGRVASGYDCRPVVEGSLARNEGAAYRDVPLGGNRTDRADRQCGQAKRKAKEEFIWS